MATSNLHVRRKLQSDQPKQEEHCDDGSKNNRKRRNEVGIAMSAVALLAVVVLLGYIFLLPRHQKRAFLQVIKNPWAHGGAAFMSRENVAGFQHHFYSGPPSYVTVVMPSVVNPKGRPNRLQSIQETWGPHARSIFVLSNVTHEFPAAMVHNAIISEATQPENPFRYPQALQVPEEIGDANGVPRLQFVIRTVHEKVNPDFAFFVNDHTFVIPEHLCKYLQNFDPAMDLYAGHALKSDNDVFNSGAAGYLLSRNTMKKLVKAWQGTDPHCTLDPNNRKSKWLQGNPGVMSAVCLKEALNVTAIDTREDSKFHRFHAFPLTRSVSGSVDKWYMNKHTAEMAQKIGADESYATLLQGDDCCAKSTVSFHYVEYLETRALFATRERLLANPHLTDKELMTLMIQLWPTGRKVGAYSRALPDSQNVEEWKALMRTVRKIATREMQQECYL
ncbi:Core 1 synthase, glycoprotein-N-acetylgalactosamine 3-beta-galactosyltransferase, 1 [Seminavis robusta]|uniref:Core 1 synthase, glycoprotein-N-acetylgalactosamine 3-beta-galactosyltransferase, 1 n=1 Tax=Seminavis robusta TaxID=568900 RepID=A0A9N8F3A0_9STRA|nr:Core 1 synthase, glycoprotein-N-acetylgalactosamine 3-beta-galactosyltransferase, 1 [Seminavis robusta]|eukprot:Sro2587_g331940.1 Core 1 synthase, glycoprotein-N-acetylgalactosamine 3-beta-galactosyltransferase, 1 (446) ;mRNA; f:7876-9213